MRHAAFATSFLATLLFSASAAFGDIPPPQAFTKSASGFKSRPLLVIVAEDGGTRPSGAAVNTWDYCSVVLDVLAGKGVKSYLVVRGFPADHVLENDHSALETSPIEVVGPATGDQTKRYVVPLRHDVTAFSVSLDSKGEDSWPYNPVGGPIAVYATGISCSIDTSAWHRR